MIHDKDIVRDIFHRVKEVLGPEFKGEIALRLENEEQKVRMDWGGAELYVPKRNSKKAKAKEKLLKGSPIQEVIKQTGISRAHVYRLIKCK